MSRQHGLDLEFVQAILQHLGTNAGGFHVAEEPAQGHGRGGFRFQMPDAGALLAQIHQLKKETEGVGDLVGAFDVEAIDDGQFAPEAHVIAVPAVADGQIPNLFEMPEKDFPGLFPDDGVKMTAQPGDFLLQNITHGWIAI
jgi:hypothetical protein